MKEPKQRVHYICLHYFSPVSVMAQTNNIKHNNILITYLLSVINEFSHAIHSF